MITFGIFNRKVALNPYPARWQLPGDLTPAHQKLHPINGKVQRSIVHALTYHEIPPAVDHFINQLPPEERLLSLDHTRRDYLSFTVLSLSEMVAVGTISAQTAWSLFYWQWGLIDKVTKDNFDTLRSDFWLRTYSDIRDEIGGAQMAGLRTSFFDNGCGGVDLLRFEFLARAGWAGLRRFEHYSSWRDKVVFSENGYRNWQMGAAVVDEYKKAAWLKMRQTEARVGIEGLNEEIRAIQLNTQGGFYLALENAAVFTVDLFNQFASGILGSSLTSEFGHWVFSSLAFHHSWVMEMMDRMNYFTERGILLSLESPVVALPPETRVFMEGVISINKNGPQYQTYPNKPKVGGDGEHEIAEQLENMIRKRILQIVPPEKRHEYYQKVKMYLVLLDLERRSEESIKEKIELFDLGEIDDYYSNYRVRAIRSLVQVLKSEEESGDSKLRAARGIGAIGNREIVAELIKVMENGSPYYTRTLAASLIKIGGDDAINYLIRALRNHKDGETRIGIAKELGEAKVAAAGEALLAALENDPFIPVQEAAANSLGQLRYKPAVAALNRLIERGRDDGKIIAAWSLGEVSDEQELPVLKEALRTSSICARGEIALAIIKILRRFNKLDQKTYSRLTAYDLITKSKWAELMELGEAAIEALELTIQTESPWFMKKPQQILSIIKNLRR
jgi:HEAT repeat protein